MKGAKGYSDRLKRLAGIRPKVSAIVYAAADELAAEAALSITAGSVSGKGHVASAPGEAPNADSGKLDRSIHVEQKRDTSATVVADAPYSVELEVGTSKMEARPYMAPAAARVKPKMHRLIAKAVQESARK